MFFSSPTDTAQAASMQLDLPTASVTMTFPSETRERHLTRLHPHRETLVPPHWHATHTEHLRVLRGWMLIIVGTQTKLYGPDSGTVDIPPYTIHGFSRGDHPNARPYWVDRIETEPSWENEDVVFEEWTTPWDGQKEIFFRNIFSFVQDNLQPALMGHWTLTLIPALLVRAVWLLNFSAHADNYPLIVGLMLGRGSDGKATMFARAVTGVVLGMAKLTASLCGWKAWKEEYTPAKLQAVAKTM